MPHSANQAVTAFIEAGHAAILANADHLSALDQAIGDGDHGVNMKRGFEALYEKRADIAAKPFPQACKDAGMALVMSVGGASGPLYGSCLMAFGKTVEDMPQDREALCGMIRGGFEAIAARGKSDRGAKTMLDVLGPVLDGLESEQATSCEDIAALAETSAAATKDILATKGRAAFLGERSVGHVDPGAQSTAILIKAICEVLKENQ